MTPPFRYPASPLTRRHAPLGYDRAASYRPWLRDEFTFRCVFCLVRERWIQTGLEVEHFEPVSRVPERATTYENLLYACRSCNGMKADQKIPDPCEVLVQGEITLGENGFLRATTNRARKIIQALGLNTRKLREYRKMWIQVIALAENHDPTLYRQSMAYPDLLPDLDRLRPPGGNGKPEGIALSNVARHGRGELPATY